MYAIRSYYVEAFFLEPVMGEGNPGMAITPEFYAEARRLTSAHGALLLVDSIQAGLRAHGVLSIVDYPGFQDVEAPDMETYSKALNAGQYPLSVLAMNERAAELYRKGVYGNTMTANPRALDVAIAVLDNLTDEIRITSYNVCYTKLLRTWATWYWPPTMATRISKLADWCARMASGG